ncbi:MAG: hypothetical protein EOO33_08825 [Comamonadaceae bacterium]|nr:MAG: hypothetical protein EOO33_08825 [Comamonadaceae bacterium]
MPDRFQGPACAQPVTQAAGTGTTAVERRPASPRGRALRAAGVAALFTALFTALSAASLIVAAGFLLLQPVVPA